MKNRPTSAVSIGNEGDIITTSNMNEIGEIGNDNEMSSSNPLSSPINNIPSIANITSKIIQSKNYAIIKVSRPNRLTSAASTGSGISVSNMNVIDDDKEVSNSRPSSGNPLNSRINNLSAIASITSKMIQSKKNAMLKVSRGNPSSFLGRMLSRRAVAEELEEEEDEEPKIDPGYIEFAYHKFINQFVISMDSFVNKFWEEAKMSSILLEGKRYSAATRIQARFRHFMWRKRFLFYLKQLAKLQSAARRKHVQRQIQLIRFELEEDWIFRLRYFYATQISKTIRMFLKKLWLRHVKQGIIDAQVAELNATRFRLKKIRMKEKRALLLMECRKINGYETIIKVSRKDTRYYSRDYSIVVAVYMRKTQTTTKFEMEEVDLRMYVQRFMNLEVVSVGDLVDKGNLRKVINERLIVRPPKRLTKPPFVIFGKNNIPQQGVKCVVRGRQINGQTFVSTVYEQGAEITAQTYHPLSSSLFITKISIPALHKWYRDDHFHDSKSELERQVTLELLKIEKRFDLYKV